MSRSPLDLVLFEPSCGGHHMHYVRRIAREALSRGKRVGLITSQESARDPRFEIALEGVPIEVIAEAAPPPKGNAMVRQLQLLRWLEATVKRERPKSVLVPFGNQLDKALALVGTSIRSSDLSILVMRDRFHLAPMGAVGPVGRSSYAEEWVHRRLLKNRHLKTLFTIDPLLPQYSRKRGFRGSDKVVYLPDPIHPFPPLDRAKARIHFGIPDDRRVLLLYGAFDGRKGVGEAMAGLAQMREDSSHILAVGRQGAGAKPYFEGEIARQLRQAGRLTEVNEYVDAEVEALAFAASDAVWVGYRGHYGQSGVLFQAAAAGRPVIATNEGLIGYEAKTGNLGVIIPDFTPVSIADAIHKGLYSPDLDLEVWKRGGEKVASDHHESNFGRLIVDTLCAQHI